MDSNKLKWVNFMRLSNYIFLICFALLIISLLSCQSQEGSNNGEKPNFIIFLIDDLGEKDIGAYGNDFIDTPVIDNLAQEGMKWTNAYSSAPVCSPARAALLTGRNSARVHFTGHITAISRHRHPENSRIVPPRDLMILPKEEVLLPEAISPAGYKSISIGKWHVGGRNYWPEDMGFDENIAGWTHGSPPSHFYPYEKPDQSWNPSIPTLEGGEEGEYLTDRLTDEAIEFIEANKEQQFLLYLSHYAVHTPLQAPKELVDKYQQKRSATGNDKIDPVYAAMVESVDQNIGRVLETLKTLELKENTVIIFASDNGAEESIADLGPYRAGKGHLYEGGIRVPFIMRWPGHITPGTISEIPTKSEDIYSTIIDIVGGEAAPGKPLDGRSLVKDFSGQTDKAEERDLIWYYPHYSPQGSMPGAAILSGEYKLLEFYDPEKVELYNLTNDPGETENLSEDMPWKILELQGKLRKKLHDMNPIMHTPNPNY